MTTENERRAAPTDVGLRHDRPKEGPRLTREQLSELVEAIPIPMVVGRASDGLILYANGHLGEMFGLPSEELIGRKTLDFYYDASDRQRLVDTLKREGRVSNWEIEAKKADGTPFWVVGSGQTAVWDGETVLIGAFHDVTDRKRAEEALLESEDRFRRLTAAAFEGIAISEKAVILEANEQLARMLGAEAAELVGRRVLDFVAPESHDTVVEAIRSQLEETYEALAVRKDGSTIPVEVRGKTIAYRGGSARVTVLRNLSARKRAEETLRESEERYRDLYDGAPVAYFAIGTDGRIAKANRRASELLGYSLDDLIGRPVLDLYSDTPAGKDKAKRVMERFRRGRETHDEEMEMRRADGSPVWVSLTVRIVRDAGGQPVEARSMVLDITERKRAEEALRMAQEELESGVELQAQGADAYGFSLRELTVLNLVASGKSDKEIGTTLGISARTAQKHVEKLCKKMGASTRTEASVRALREALIR